MPDQPQNRTHNDQTAGKPGPQLALLGDFAVVGPDGRAVAIATKKNRAMLAILALSPGRHATRERLCGLLWSDRGEEQARSSLRQSLAVLRKELGELEAEIIQTRDDQIALQPVFVDADAVAAAARSGNLAACRDAAGLLRGELLADTAIRDEAFEPWLAAERRKCADAAATVLERLASAETGQDRIAYAKHLVEMDPLREASHRALMLAYHESGENGLALKQFETCRSLLQEELGAEPAPATVELRQRLAAMPAAPVPPTLKADDGPMPAVVVTPGAGLPIAATVQPTKPTIAVLPLTNLSGDTGQHYLADGISEDIITGLARFGQLAVVARNLSFRHRGDVDVKQAARELEAAYVVEGSLRRAGDRLRITVQLISGQTGKHVWADAYDVVGAELFETQDQVVRKIVATLGGRITDASARQARMQHPGSLAAYELVLRANALDWESREAKQEARRMLERALTLDPDYATAHSLLAAVSLREASYHTRLTPEALDTCLVHARRAIEIDANDSACHSILGWVLIARGDFDLAAEHLARAERLNPNNPFVMTNRGSLLNQTGRPDEAIACFEQVQAVDPYFNPSWLREKLGFAHFQARRYGECIAQLNRAPKKRFYMHAILAAAHAMAGDLPSAETARQAGLATRPDCTVETVASLLPCARAEDRAHLSEALVRAGFQHDALQPEPVRHAVVAEPPAPS